MSPKFDADQAETSDAAQVTAIAFCRDGRLRAIGRYDGSIEVSDQHTGRVLWHESPPATGGGRVGVETLDFSPTGQLLVSGGDDQAVRLWIARTGHPLRATTTDSLISQVAFSPDGNRLVAGVDDDAGTLLFLDGTTGSLVRTLYVGAAIYGVAWLNGGRVAADSGRWTFVIAAGSGRTTHTIPGDANTTKIASNPGGTILALLNGSGALTPWDATKWRQLDALSTDKTTPPTTSRSRGTGGSSLRAARTGGWSCGM